MNKPIVVRTINFRQPPPTGTILMKEGQRYEVKALEPHTRKDGSKTTLIVWQSHCAETGHPFEIRTGLKCKYVNRRCKQHGKPGKPVSRAGRQRQLDFLGRQRRAARRAQW